MASSFVASARTYAQAIGSVTYTDTSGLNPVKKTVVLIARYEEQTKITRGYKYQNGEPIITLPASLVMRTYTYNYGSIFTDGGVQSATFDYEYSSEQSELHRVSEAGFYEVATTTRLCVGIYAATVN